MSKEDNYSNCIMKLNKLSLKKLKILEQYIQLMKNVEVILDEFRFNLSKTKTTLGHNLVSSTMMDLRELDPLISVKINEKNDKNFFQLQETLENSYLNLDDIDENEINKDCVNLNTENSSGNNSNDNFGIRKRVKCADELTERKEDTKNKENQKNFNIFRPFGLLEPICAKSARQNIKTVLPLLCDLANLQYEVRCINAAIDELNINNIFNKIQLQ